MGDALPGASVQRVDGHTTRPGNVTARVSFADRPPVYVKTATDTAERLVREAAATRHARAHCGVHAPTVVAADPEGEPPYLVTGPLPGTLFNERWTGDGDRAALLRAVGRALAGVHAARLDTPGAVTGWDGDRLATDGAAWAATLADTLRWRGEDWFPDRFSDLPGAVADLVEAVGPTLEGVAPTLLHADPSRINLHVEPLGLLDWERALVGDPAMDLVEAAFHHLGQPDVGEDERPALRAALEAGYREERGGLPPTLERYEPLYRATAHLLVAQAFEDWAPPLDEPTDALAEQVREESRSRREAARAALL